LFRFLEFAFEMRIRIKKYCSGFADLPFDIELTFEDIPNLSKAMIVLGMIGSRFKTQDTGVRFSGTLFVRMKQHLTRLSGPSNSFPFDGHRRYAFSCSKDSPLGTRSCFIGPPIQKIYGGTNELMKLLIARSL
jgi:hypothetical protein